ncbi:MAG: threonine/serine dehydratase [Micropepsaceae bacterium]
MPPSAADLAAAARRLRGVAVATPLLPAAALTAELGRPVFVKAETLQRTGSFKFRGAFNRIAAMTDDQRGQGVVAFSSGNHAQGVAAAARIFGCRAAIVMPSDAPIAKIAGTRGYGAEVVLYDRERESREEISEALAAERGAVLIPSFDDPHVIAGQGTVGLEIAAAIAGQGLVLGAVVTPLGGGGLASGIALAMEAVAPAARLFAAEPEHFDDAARSFAAGRILANDRKSGSSQDALLTPELSALTFGILRPRIAGMSAVPDGAAEEAVRYAARHLKLVVEPGGAAGLAAVLAGDIPQGEGALVIVLSGANV